MHSVSIPNYVISRKSLNEKRAPYEIVDTFVKIRKLKVTNFNELTDYKK